MARRLDSREPILDARLPDKCRVNIILDPCYNRGACIAIRKFPENHFTWEQLMSFGSIDQIGVAILEMVFRLGKNILISGGAGTGKTTMLNALASFIPAGDIVVTVEDAREIALSNELWVALETKRALDGEDRDVTLRDLVRTSLRMNPRWIIVGEVRGPKRSIWCALSTPGTAAQAPSTPIPLTTPCLPLRPHPAVRPGRARPRGQGDGIPRHSVVLQMHELPDHSRRLIEIAEIQGLDYDTRSSSRPTSSGPSTALSSPTTTAAAKPTGSSSSKTRHPGSAISR